MKRTKHIRIPALLVAASFVFTATAAAQVPKTIMIRHQMRGCHTWSFANGPFKATLKVSVGQGSELRFVNNDVMPHKLIQVAGPKASIQKPNMNHMSARAFVTFPKAGTYKFTTKPGEDYMKGMKTIGEDNVLRLIVTVSK